MTSVTHFKDAFWGPKGFDELRKLVKHGSDFTKEIANVLNERSELETTYAKGLLKLSLKLHKIAKDNYGTTANAWLTASDQMEAEAETHRVLSLSLTDEVVKPLRHLCENQAKTRKHIEYQVEKRLKHLHERRSEDAKLKRQTYQYQRDVERLYRDVESTSSEKELLKLESKKQKAIDLLQKTDVAYYNSCLMGERARQEWESSVYESSRQLQEMEKDRLTSLVEALQRYTASLSMMSPAVAHCVEKLETKLAQVNTTSDILKVVETKGTGPNIPEQLLPDFFAEDLHNQMQLDRRKESLEKFLMMIMRDLEMERKGRDGVENLAKVFQETPRFGDEDAQADVKEKLRQLKQTLAYLEATRYKIQCTLLSLQGELRPSHPLSAHIEVHRDKQGHPQSILKIPTWISRGNMDFERTSSQNSESSEGIYSGTSNEMFNRDSSSDFEEDFEDLSEEDNMSENPIYGKSCSLRSTSSSSFRKMSTLSMQRRESNSHFKVLYDFDASETDELSLKQGDVVNVLKKNRDGWWLGEVFRDGQSFKGNFPSTYVEEADA